jgi:hypothetical protein
MTTFNAADKIGLGSSLGNGIGSQVDIQISPAASPDATMFRSMFDRQVDARSMNVQPADNKGSLSSAVAERTTALAESVTKDQQYVSRLLETATRSGSSMDLMRAMMALNDYQLRVQTISKSVSKASSSIDQLTKLQ